MDVGVDAGTTVTKAVAFDGRRWPLARAARPTVLDRAGRPLRTGRRRGLLGQRWRCSRVTVAPGPASRRHRAGRRAVAARRRRAPGPPRHLLAGRPHSRSSSAGRRTASPSSRTGGPAYLFPGAAGPLLSWLDTRRAAPSRLGPPPRPTARTWWCSGSPGCGPPTRPTHRRRSSTRTRAGTTTRADRRLRAQHRQGLLAPVHCTARAASGGRGRHRAAGGCRSSARSLRPAGVGRGAGVGEPGDGLLTVGTTLACQVLRDTVDGEPAGLTLSTWTPNAGCGRYPRWSAPPPSTGCCGWSAPPLPTCRRCWPAGRRQG